MPHPIIVSRAKLGSFYFAKENMGSAITYFKDAWKELGKITWPTRKQSIRLTIAVAVFSLVFALLIGAIDFGLAELAKRLFVGN